VSLVGPLSRLEKYGVALAVSVCALSAFMPARRGLPNLLAERVQAASPATSGPSGQAKPKRRLFEAKDLGLLEAPDREQWQKPELIMDALGIADGSVVADVGAGQAWFTLHIARRVGPNGIVYAEDIQPAMLEAIGQRVQVENLLNVRPVLGTPSDPHLPKGLDAALIVDSYREMDDPADSTLVVTLLKNIARSLKLQGRLGIVDFTPGGGRPGPAPDQRVDPQAVIKAASAAGLHLILRERIPPFLFLLVFWRN
jgi:SAM-dependent methyltransferase